MTTNAAAVDAAHAARANGGALVRVGRRTWRVVSIVVCVCALHASLLTISTSGSSVQIVSVPPRVVTAQLIPQAPAAIRPAAAPPPMHRAASAPRRPPASQVSRADPAPRSRAPERTQQAVRNVPAAPSPPQPAAIADRRSAPRQAANGAMPDTVPAAPVPVAASPTAPRFVAHLDCALVKPEYPPQSLRLGEHGTAVVELETDAGGRVSAVRIVTGSGYTRLDTAAREAVLASRCSPHREDGTAVPAKADVPITFNLDE